MKEPDHPIDKPASLPSPLLVGTKEAKDLQSNLDALNESLKGLPAYKESPGKPKIDLNSAALGGQRRPNEDVTCYDNVVGPNDKEEDGRLFTVPTLASLAMDPESSGAPQKAAVPGGEAEALRRLSEIVKDNKYMATFAKPKTSPSCDTNEPSTTLLSPFLKFGCLSIRKLWYDSIESIKGYKGGGKTTPPESYEGQLLFREMYACAEHAVGDSFQFMQGNSVCRFMDWYLPTEFDGKGNIVEPRPRGDEESESRLEKFRAGQTGFPWIDAGARQLRSTGWIHHLMRHSLASFLTRGHCWISWERGAEMFEEYLLDWDPNSNAGNWMWLSCSAFYSQFFRVYGAASFPVKYDKGGSLVRKYCPELKDYPDKYIYSPHLAPLHVQKQAGCIIGKDYPAPMLDEKEEKAMCLARIKTAFSHKLYGNSKEVKDGTATEILRKAHGQPHPKPTGKQEKNEKIPDWAKAGQEAKTNTENGGDKVDTPDKKRKAETTASPKKAKAKVGK
jgi:cryptochrome